jgi:hypothetical protein
VTCPLSLLQNVSFRKQLVGNDNDWNYLLKNIPVSTTKDAVAPVMPQCGPRSQSVQHPGTSASGDQLVGNDWNHFDRYFKEV